MRSRVDSGPHFSFCNLCSWIVPGVCFQQLSCIRYIYTLGYPSTRPVGYPNTEPVRIYTGTIAAEYPSAELGRYPGTNMGGTRVPTWEVPEYQPVWYLSTKPVGHPRIKPVAYPSTVRSLWGTRVPNLVVWSVPEYPRVYPTHTRVGTRV